MSDLKEAKEEKQDKQKQWKLQANTEYQKVVPIIMNLATASLVLPVVFAKDFLPTLNQKGSVEAPISWAFWGWGLLGGSLVFGCAFHISAAKLVKALYGGYDDKETWLKTLYDSMHWSYGDARTCQEYFHEKIRDISVGGLVFFFLAGL